MDRSIRTLELDKIIEKVAGYARSENAKNMVYAIRPSRDVDEIEYMHRLQSEVLSVLIKYEAPPIGVLYDLERELKLSSIGSSLTPYQLLRVADTVRSIRRLKQYFTAIENIEVDFPEISVLSANLRSERELEEKIENAIVDEDTISDNASRQLKSIRQKINRKGEEIRKKLNSLITSRDNDKYLQEHIVTIRNGRFVVPVKSEYRHAIKGMIHDRSSKGSTLYIEPVGVLELNNDLNELKIEERKEIERILAELSANVGERSSFISNSLKFTFILDFEIAKGRFAVENDAIVPEIARQKILKLVKARHPLIDKNVVVPLSVEIGKDFSMLLITGPNTGGKTVSLKTIGLMCLMSQSGIPVTAAHGTSLPVFDNILSDIGDEQSIEQSLSTFSSHMVNIVDILKRTDNESLVLLDELGAGTDPVEGAALARAILEKLHKANCLSVSTTHYSELKHYALRNKGFINGSMEFDVNTLSPTYKLTVGIPGKSNAFEISRKLGLGDDVISKAQTYIEPDSAQIEEVLAALEEKRVSIEEAEEAARRNLRDSEILKNRLSEKESKFLERRDKVLKDAKNEASKILRDAKETTDRVIKELRTLGSAGKEAEKLRTELRESTKKLSNPIKEVKVSMPPEKLKKGDSINVPKLGNKGVVFTEPDEKGNFTASIGIMKVSLNISEVELISEKAISYHEPKTRKREVEIRSVSTSLDLRGMNIEDSRIEIDRFLDEAFMGKVQKVEIIHGKGTGVLRKGVKEFLRTHKHVKSERDGAYNEGGLGVTIVEIR